MEVIPISMGWKTTLRLVERLRDDAYPWRTKTSGDQHHPATILESDPVKAMQGGTGNACILMERDDRPDTEQARRDAATMLSMLVDTSLRPVSQGIGSRVFLATVFEMLDRMGRRADVHALGPWLPIRICVKDDSPPPFGPATLAAWNAACAPGLQVTSDLRRRRCVVGSPQTMHNVPSTRHPIPIVELMRTIPLLQDLIVD